MGVKKIENKDLMDCAGKNVDFLQCNVPKPMSDFYDSWSPYNITNIKKLNRKTNKQEFVHKTKFCKECLGKIYSRYKEETSSSEFALFLTCMQANIPFIAEKVESTFAYVTSEAKRGARVTNIFGYYYSMLAKETSKHHLWQDFSCTDIDYKDIATHIEKRDIQKKDVEQLELDWGKQSDIENYALLDYWFEELLEGRTVTKAEELLYRDLCLARLSKRKIEQYNPDSKGENEDVSKVQTQINNLMKLLKIDNFQEKKQESLVERMLESRIAIIEKEKPAFHYADLKKNEDFLGRGKYFYDHIYRPFKNVLKGSKLYNIVPDEEDDKTTEDYETEMLEGRDMESEEIKVEEE